VRAPVVVALLLSASTASAFVPPTFKAAPRNRATIVQQGELYSGANAGDCFTWPSPWVKQHGGYSGWGGWYPANGMTGVVIGTSKHCFDPNVTIYIIDFGADHFAALNQRGIRLE